MRARVSTFVCYTSLIACAPLFSQVSVLTGQYDISRNNWNSQETILNTSNVNASHFGLLFSRAVDGFIYAQPLLVAAPQLKGWVNVDVVYVATLNNSVYAFDADNPANSQPLWQANLGPPLTSSNPFLPEIGILSTPVINPKTKTMYVVSYNLTGGVTSYLLHALDITSGSERFGGPVTIQGSVPGTGYDNVNGVVTFKAGNLLQRPALLLYNGNVVMAFGTLHDQLAYHGWVFAYNAGTLQQASVICSTPNGKKGGIWMSGVGPAADSNGLYVVTGDGSFGSGDVGDSVVRYTISGARMTDYFTPSDYHLLFEDDWDFGAGGPLLIPNTNLVVSGGKVGTLFLMQRTNLGHLQGSASSSLVQSFQATPGCSSSLWNGCDEIHHLAWYSGGGANNLLYLWAWNDALKAFSFSPTTSQFNATPAVQNPAIANFPGGMLAVSSNGGTPGSAILWATMSSQNAADSVVPGMLRAFDALTLTEIWNSNMNPSDNLGNLAKFSVPTVANGKVYVSTFSNKLMVYANH